MKVDILYNDEIGKFEGPLEVDEVKVPWPNCQYWVFIGIVEPDTDHKGTLFLDPKEITAVFTYDEEVTEDGSIQETEMPDMRDVN